MIIPKTNASGFAEFNISNQPDVYNIFTNPVASAKVARVSRLTTNQFQGGSSSSVFINEKPKRIE